jgi:hypothetical protein
MREHATLRQVRKVSSRQHHGSTDAPGRRVDPSVAAGARVSGTSTETLWRRVGYGGRKGRRAAKRLADRVIRADRWTVGVGAAYAARWASNLPSDMASGVLLGSRNR